jgi:hypothetical protein
MQVVLIQLQKSEANRDSAYPCVNLVWFVYISTLTSDLYYCQNNTRLSAAQVDLKATEFIEFPQFKRFLVQLRTMHS